MFCFNCGASLPDVARFCSACGTSLASSTADGGSPTVSSPLHSPPPIYTPSPGAPSSTLLSPTGYPQAAFDRLAGILFNALDQNVQPQRTGALEVSKMIAYRSLGGLTVSPFYGEYVLPTYASVIGIELVRNQPPIISWNGWRQFLIQKILFEPEASFYHLSRVLSVLAIPIPLTRADFPLTPDLNALAKETQFRTQIGSMAQRAFGGGAMGGAWGGGMGNGMAGGFGGGGANGGAGSAAVQAISQIVAQNGMNIMNASMGGGGTWFMGGGSGC